jgi:hypothetical protein
VIAGRNPHFFGGIAWDDERVDRGASRRSFLLRHLSFVRPRRRLSSAPTVDFERRRAQKLSRSAVAPPGRHTPTFRGRALTASSTAACLIGSGLKAAGICAGLGVGVSHSADEASCRMFLCACCRSQVLVCSGCDRGQIYCLGTCAQEARRANQREARRRYQATPRGRAMHAARNRRYRARGRCVTDQGPDNGHKAGPLLASDVDGALSRPSSSRKAPPQWLCHHCRRSASAFARLSALRPRRDRRKNSQISRRGSLRSRPP